MFQLELLFQLLPVFSLRVFGPVLLWLLARVLEFGLSHLALGCLERANTFSVNPGVLDHFYFSSVDDQIAGSPFSITIAAKDLYNNTVAGYSGAPSLTCSAGSISPTSMAVFVDGVGLRFSYCCFR